MDLWLDILSGACLAIGGLCVLIGTIGVLRFPNFFTRMHATGITDTTGIGFLFIGLCIEAGWSLVLLKLILIMLFLFFTNPTSAHALAKAAIHGGMSPTTMLEETSHRTDA